MTKQDLNHQIIHNRREMILELIKLGSDPARIEREAALLALDTIDGLSKRSVKEACDCFIAIDYALDKKTRDKFSQEFLDLLNEGIILEEVGAKHGPNLDLMLKLAQNILKRDSESKRLRIKNFVADLRHA